MSRAKPDASRAVISLWLTANDGAAMNRDTEHTLDEPAGTTPELLYALAAWERSLRRKGAAQAQAGRATVPPAIPTEVPDAPGVAATAVEYVNLQTPPALPEQVGDRRRWLLEVGELSPGPRRGPAPGGESRAWPALGRRPGGRTGRGCCAQAGPAAFRGWPVGLRQPRRKQTARHPGQRAVEARALVGRGRQLRERRRSNGRALLGARQSSVRRTPISFGEAGGQEVQPGAKPTGVCAGRPSVRSGTRHGPPPVHSSSADPVPVPHLGQSLEISPVAQGFLVRWGGAQPQAVCPDKDGVLRLPGDPTTGPLAASVRALEPHLLQITFQAARATAELVETDEIPNATILSLASGIAERPGKQEHADRLVQEP